MRATSGLPRQARSAPDAFGQLEALVLQTFIQSMLPKNATHVFGKGIAGDIWKSMLAEKLGQRGRAQRTRGAGQAPASRVGRGPSGAPMRSGRGGALRHPRRWRACSPTCRIRTPTAAPTSSQQSEILMLGSFAPSAQQPAPARANDLGVAGRPADSAAAAPAPLDRVIERLEEVVDQETAALRNRDGHRSQGLQQPQEPGASGAQSRLARSRRSAEGQGGSGAARRPARQARCQPCRPRDAPGRRARGCNRACRRDQGRRIGRHLFALHRRRRRQAMIKLILSGLWVCLVTLASTYAAVSWLAPRPPRSGDPDPEAQSAAWNRSRRG